MRSTHLTPSSGSEPGEADIRRTPCWLYRVETWSLYRVESEFQNGSHFARAITNFWTSVPAPDRFPS